MNESALKQYIDYVKNNKVILEGSAKAQIPCMYNDGGSCRIRMKLHFNVINSLTRDNLLYMDLNSEKIKTYSKDSYDIYIDANMGYVFGSKQVYVSQQDIVSMLLDMSKEEILVK